MRSGPGVFRKALVDSIPVAMGYVTMGFAAGVLMAVKAGVDLPALWSGLTAVTSLSGTLQFVAVDMFRTQAAILDAALLTFAISFRYALYGFSMLDKFRGVSLWKKLYMIEGLTDETYALECACGIEDRRDFVRYCLTLTALNQSYWVFGTISGAIAGAELPIPSRGIEFAMVALFIVIFADQMRLIAKAGLEGPFLRWGRLKLFLCAVPCFAALALLAAPKAVADAAASARYSASHTLCIVLACWAVIYVLRAFPFIVFGREGAQKPKWLGPLEKWISPATIALLIVYSYWGLSKARPDEGGLLFCLCGSAAGLATVAMHYWRRNPLLAIVSGTVLYMLLIRAVDVL